MTKDGSSFTPPPSPADRLSLREWPALALGRDAVPAPRTADGEPGSGTGTLLPAPLQLFVLSFLMLFVELALIRWLGAQRRLPVVLLQLRPAGQLPRHRHRLPAGPVPRQSLPVCPGRAGPAGAVSSCIFPVEVTNASGADHLLRIGVFAEDHGPAHVGHAARRLHRRRRRDGDDRRGCRPQLRPVPAARRVPARHSAAASPASSAFSALSFLDASR